MPAQEWRDREASLGQSAVSSPGIMTCITTRDRGRDQSVTPTLFNFRFFAKKSVALYAND